MSLWCIYVKTGEELTLVEECEAIGIPAKAPRKVEAVRTGNKRWPEPRVTPYLPNYVFVWVSPDQWHWLKGLKYVRDMMGVIPQWEPKVREFIDTVEADYARRSAEIEQAQKIMMDRDATKEARREAIRAIQSYQPGDMLEVICGPFAGQLVAFGAMVERANSITPEIEVSMGELQWGTVRLDPLHVKRAG